MTLQTDALPEEQKEYVFVRPKETAEDTKYSFIYASAFGGRVPEYSHALPARYFLWEIQSEGKRLELKSPLEIALRRGESGFTASADLLDASGYWNTREEALADFQQFFIYDYSNLSRTPKAELHSSAQRLLKQYSDIISELNP